MELRQLRQFIALAEAGSFHAAAARLNMAQPPLTVSIRKLEDEIGATLFARGARGTAPTAAALAALPHARAALAEIERFRASAREGGEGRRGRLRIGFVGSATFEVLPRLVRAYRARYPHVEVVLEESSSVEIAKRLLAREIDAGLVRLPLFDEAGITVRTIDRDELHVAVAADSPRARRRRIALAELAGEPFVVQSRISVLHTITLMACHEAGFSPTVAQEAVQLGTVLALVRSGLGVALVPACVATAAPAGVTLVPLERRLPIAMGLALPIDRSSQLAANLGTLADTAALSP